VLGGKPSSRGNRHFIEHFEIARTEHIEACARMGIYLSMQPQFDLLWGGSGRMYEDRLGTARMRSMNALGRIQRAGAILCGGDDSPVCNLSPLEGMTSAAEHHEPQERLTAQQAVTMYTYNAAKLAHVEDRTGLLAPGYAGDFVVLDRDPLDGVRFTDCSVLSTWSDGNIVYQC
jgi:predicted amidohydrolase YtcJ